MLLNTTRIAVASTTLTVLSNIFNKVSNNVNCEVQDSSE